MKEDWATHILTCGVSASGSAFTQMGLLFLGSIKPNPTPVPKSLGHLTSLNRPHLASLLIPPCQPERLKVLVSPLSVILGNDDFLVLAYDAGPRGQRMEGGAGGIIFNSAPGELCLPGVAYTRDFRSGRGMQMRGSCLMFWLKPGRDLTSDDFEVLDGVVRGFWPTGSGPATEEMLKNIALGYVDRKEEIKKAKEEAEAAAKA